MTRDPVHYEPKTTYECSCCGAVAENAPHSHEGSSSCDAEILTKNAGWYFWDETWAYRYGPYPTKEVAREACINYAKSLG